MRRIYTICLAMAFLLLQGRPVSAQDKVWGFNPVGGAATLGSIYRVNPADNSVQTVYSLLPDTSNYGMTPYGRLTEYNGLLYGVTSAGGSSNAGVIFSFDPATGNYKVLYNFDNTHGGGPTGSLTVYNNLLYGTANVGGAGGFGALFSFDPATNAYTDLFDFDNTHGSRPYGSLTIYNNYLYGTTSIGGSGFGVVFRWDPAANTLLSLSLATAIASQPFGDLTMYNGLFYGTSKVGGVNKAGTIFSVDPNLSGATLRHTFTWVNATSKVKEGGVPQCSLTLYNNVLYGLSKGGPTANGQNLLFSFAPGSDPSGDVYAMPVVTGLGAGATYNSLVVFNNLLYGMTTQGIVFSYNPTSGGSTVTNVATIGNVPTSSMIVYNNLLYGMVTNGGAGRGELFSVDPSSGAYKRLVSLTLTNVKNGAMLYGKPLAIGDKLYGGTTAGGLNNKGIFFAYDRGTGEFKKLADLDPAGTGTQPGNMVVADSIIYGAMQTGGTYNEGALFSFDLRTGGPLKKLADLGNSGDPNSPAGGVQGNMVLLNSKLYLTTVLGGAGNDGAIYSYDLSSGSFAKVHDYDPTDKSGAFPAGGLVVGDNGLIYGQTVYGGDNNQGVIYSIDPLPGMYNVVYPALKSGVTSSVGDLVYRNDSLFGLTLNNPQTLYAYSISNNSYALLHTFDRTNEGNPNGSLVISGSKLYGVVGSPDHAWNYDLVSGAFSISQPLEATFGAGYFNSGIAVTSPLSQQITLGDVSLAYGDADLDPAASASSKLAVTYTTGDPSIATIVGGKVHALKAGVTTITASQAGNDAFLAASPVTVNLVVKKAVLLAHAKDTTMVYGSVNTSRLSYYYSGFVNGQDSTVLLTQPVVTTDAAATSHVRSSNYTITVAGATAANYDIQYVDGALVITPKPLVIKADDKQKLTGGSDPVFTATSSGFASAADSLALLPTVQFTVQPDGAAYDIIPSGVVSADYQISYANGTMTVGSTAFQPVTGKTYGDADFMLSAAAPGGVTPVYSGDNSAVATVSADGIVHILHAGTVTLSADLGSAGTVKQVLTIAAKSLIVTADDQLIHFGDAIPVLTLQYSGWVNGDGSGSLSQAPVASTTATASSPGGIYPITISGGSAADYQLVYVAGRLTVSTLPWQGSTISFDPIAGKTYGDVDFVASVSSTNPNMPIVLKSSNSNVATIVNGMIHLTGAGQVTITASQEGDISHTAAPDVSQQFTVASATLTATADNKTKAYGQTVPSLTISYSGWVGSDGPSVLTSRPVASVAANSASAPGVYPINVSGGSAANYTFRYVQGTLTITLSQQVITFRALPMATYGDADFAAGAVSSNTSMPLTYKSSDPSVATVSAGGVVHILGAGTTTITVSQAGAGNYSAATDAVQVLTVRPAVMTITPDDKVKVQGQSNPGFTFNYAGLAQGDDSSMLAVAPVAQTTAENSSLPGLYVITASGAVANGKYSITYRTGSLRVVVDSSLVKGGDKLDSWTSSPTTLEVEVFALASQNAVIQVYSLYGQQVLSKPVYLVGADNHFTLPVAGLVPGMYIVRVTGQYLKLSQKIRIQ